MGEVKIIDGTDMVLGRLGSAVAKRLLEGEKIAIINAEKIVISTLSDNIVEKYRKRRSAKDKANPEHSPHWPRRPDLLVKRIIRGMLPFDKWRGRRAVKNLKVYIGIPEGLSGTKLTLPIKTSKNLCKYISIDELCKKLGYGS